MLNYIMRIFKYIFKMSILNTLISFLVIIGLVWVSQSFRSIKFIFEKGGTILDFFQLSIFSMPAWLSISVSFGFFFGVFITFTKLENDRELIAMKSSGLSAVRLFTAIDQTDDGHVSRREIRTAVNTLLKDSVKVSDIDAMLETFDANGDGVISLDEFLSVMEKHQPAQFVPVLPDLKPPKK